MHFQKIFAFLAVLCTASVFSQTTTSHKVKKGETVYSIAKIYHVKMDEILDLNPKAKNKLSLGMLLKIPGKAQKTQKETQKEKESTIVHEVAAKETLYGISKKYKVSLDKIKELNPTVDFEGLKIGTKLIISGSDITSEEEVAFSKEIIHEVAPKETKYGISKRYGVTIKQLEEANPEIVNDLPIGFKLHIKGAKNHLDEVVAVKEIQPVKEPKVIPVPEKPVQEEDTDDEEATNDEEKVTTEQGTSQIKVVDSKPSEIPTIPVPPLSADSVTKAEFLITKASENLGVRYRGGGTTKDGFDCSGLVFSTFKNIEMVLPRSSREMAGYGTTIDRTQAQKGDLIFFTTNGRGTINHVGLITEVLEDEIKFIHSSVSAGVIVSSTKEAYYTKRFVKVNRVLP